MFNILNNALIKPTILEQKYVQACLDGNTSAVTYMMKRENKSFKRTALINKCLENAFEGGHKDIAEILLKCSDLTKYKMCDNVRGYYLSLRHAFRGGNIDIIDMVGGNGNNRKFNINNCVDTNTAWICGLYGACETNRVDLFEMYLSKIDPAVRYYTTKFKNFLDECIQHAFISVSVNFDIINYLLDKGATIDGKCLEYACRGNSMENIEFIIKYGTENNVHYSIHDWNRALHITCVHGNFEIVKFIVPNKTLPTQYQMLSCYSNACIRGHLEIVNFFIDRGVNDWVTGLRGACQGGSLDVLKLMVRNGAITNNNEIGFYCHNACVHGHPEVAKFLVSLDFDAFISPLNQWLDYTSFCDDLDLVKIITSRPYMNWNEGLKHASGGRNVNIVKTMLDGGATDINGVLLFATNNMVQGYTDIMTLLYREGANVFSFLERTTDFKLYCLYRKSLGVSPKTGDKYFTFLQEYPPCVLFVGCKLTLDTNCHIKKLPIELFRLLSEY